MSYVHVVLLFHNFVEAWFTLGFKLNVGIDLRCEYI